MTTTRQKGISPKLLATLLASIITFIAGWQGIDLSPEVAFAVASVIAGIAGYAVGPGDVEIVRDVATLEGRPR
jgi:hypothetical protein